MISSTKICVQKKLFLYTDLFLRIASDIFRVYLYRISKSRMLKKYDFLNNNTHIYSLHFKIGSVLYICVINAGIDRYLIAGLVEIIKIHIVASRQFSFLFLLSIVRFSGRMEKEYMAIHSDWHIHTHCSCDGACMEFEALINDAKKYTFSMEEPTEIARLTCKEIENTEVISDAGLLADLARRVGACAIVKGVRNEKDLEYEREMALYNEKKNPDAKTVILPCDPALAQISSTAVRERLAAGQDISDIVSQNVIEYILNRVKA